MCLPRLLSMKRPRRGRAITGVDVLLPDLLAVLVMVIAPVSVDRLRPPPGPAAAPAHRRDGRDQRHQLGHVVAVAAGQRHRQRDPVRLGDHMVLGARPGTVDRARPRFGPPLTARTWELSITAVDQSSAPAVCSSASSSSCSCCHTPASCQSRSRRQHVIPGPKPSSCGKNSHGIPCTARTRCPIGPCGHPAACATGDQPAWEPRAAAARSAPITRPAPSTAVAGPSLRPAQPPHDHQYSQSSFC